MGALLEAHSKRLRRVIALRLDRRLRGRVDEADVVQDAFLEALRRIDEYLGAPAMPFYLWLRFIALQRLQTLCREHLGAKMRDVRREMPLERGAGTEASSEALASQLLGKLTTPSRALIRAELKARFQDALETLEDQDREIIALRNFEQLSNIEAAQVLSIGESAASKRYIRAVRRLRTVLSEVQGISGLSWT